MIYFLDINHYCAKLQAIYLFIKALSVAQISHLLIDFYRNTISITCNGSQPLRNSLFFSTQIPVKSFTAFAHIYIGHVKVPRIPRVSYRSGLVRKIQKLIYLMLSVLPYYPQHISDIGIIHANQIIVFFIVRFRHLYRPMPHAGNPFLPQLGQRPIMNTIADFLRAGRSGVNVKVCGSVLSCYDLFHHEFRHGRTADVAVADEKYFYHCFQTPCFAQKCPVLLGFPDILCLALNRTNVVNQSIF